MRGDLVYEKLGEIDPALVAEALPEAAPMPELYHLGGNNPPPPKKRPNFRKALVVCACILLAGILLVGGGAVLSRVKDQSADHPSHETEAPWIDPTVNGTNGVSEPETVPEPAPDPESQPFSFGYELTTPSTVSGGDTVDIILSLTNNGAGFSYYGCASDYAPKAKLIAAVAGETVTLEVEYATTSDAAEDHWIDTGDTGKGHIYVTIPSDEYLHGASFDLVLTYKDHSRVFRDVLTVDTAPSETYGGEVEVFAANAENDKLLDVSLTENEEQKKIGDALVSVFNTNSPVFKEEYEDVIANVRFRVGGSVLWYNTNSGHLTDRATKTQYRLTHVQMTTVNSHLEDLWNAYGVYETHLNDRFRDTVDKLAYQEEDIYTNHDLEIRMYARRITALLNTATPVEDNMYDLSAYGFVFGEIHWGYHAYEDRPCIHTIDHRAEDNCLELDPDTNVELRCIMETIFKDAIAPACGFSFKTSTILRKSTYKAVAHYDDCLYDMVKLSLRHKETGYEIPKTAYTFYYDVFVIPEDAPFGEYELVAYLWGEMGSGVFRTDTTAVTVVPESKPAEYTFSYKILNRKLSYKAGDTLLIETLMTNKGDTITRFGNSNAVFPKARLVNVKNGSEIVIELENGNLAEDGALIRTLKGGKTISPEQSFEIPEGVESGIYDLVLYFEEHERVFKNAVAITGS